MKILFEIVADQSQAALAIERLRLQVREFRKELRQEGIAADRVKELNEQIAITNVEIGKLQTQQKSLSREFKAAQFPKDSIVGLRIEYAKLFDQVTRLSAADRESTFGQKLVKDAANVKKEIDRVEQSMGRFTGNVGNYKAAFASLADIISGGLIGGGLVVTINAITRAFSEGLDELEAYGAGLDRLSAITGVTGDALEDLRQRAEGLTTIKIGNSEIVNTATDIFEAFTLVGSARPELLQDAAALEEVTKQAIILSKASGDDLQTSVTALTTTMGQFKEEANQSNRIINELAAGSKVGASEIRDTTVALQKFGTTAAVSNVSTSESIALIETLADRQLKGEEAGTQLRNILAKLAGAEILPKKALVELEQAGVSLDVLKDTTLPLITRLQELGKIEGNTAALTKVFGLENLAAAQILTQGIPKYQELLAGIQGTNEAYKQAGINADNLKTRTENLEKQGINLLIKAFIGLEPIISETVEFLSDLIDLLADAPEIISENAEEFAALGLVVLSLNRNVIALTTAQGRQAIATAISTTATEASTIATRALGVAQAALPLLALVAGLYAIAKAFEAYEESASASEKATRAVAEAEQEVAKESAKQVEAVRKNIEILKTEIDDKDKRKRAIDELIKVSPDYLKTIDLEKASIKELTAIQNELTDGIIRSVAERRKASAQEDIAGKIIEQQLEVRRLERQAPTQVRAEDVGQFVGAQAVADIGTENARISNLKAIEDAKERLRSLQDEYDKTGEAYDEAFGIGNGERAVSRQGQQLLGFVQDISQEFGIMGNEAKENSDKAADALDKTGKSAEDAAIVTGAAAARSKKSEQERLEILNKQIERIDQLKNSIRTLDASTILNKFDRQVTELEIGLAQQLQPVQQGRATLAQKVAGQGGKETAQDVIESNLLSEQEASIRASFQRQIEVVNEARNEATEKAKQELERAALEIEQLAKTNAQRLAEIEGDLFGAGIERREGELRRGLDARISNLREQLIAKEITEREFQEQSLEAQAEFNRKSADLERERATASVTFSEVVKKTKIEAAKAALDAELQNIEQSRQAEIKALKERGITEGVDVTGQIEAVDTKAIEQRKDAFQDYSDAVNDANAELEATQIKTLDAVNEKDKEVQEDKLRRLEQERAKREELQQFLLASANTISNAVFEIERNRLQQETDTRLDALDAEYDTKISKAKGNDALIAKLEKERETKRVQIERQAANERKKIAIREAIIQGALAVVEALPNLFAAAAAAIATAAQIAVINSQTFEKGGVVKLGKPGRLAGQLHTHGGTKGVFSDGTKVEMEKDELLVVVNRFNARKIRHLSQLNSADGHGIAFAHGGILTPNLLTKPERTALRKVHTFQQGGFLATAPQLSVPGASSSPGERLVITTVATISEDDMKILAEIVAEKVGAASRASIAEGLNDANRLNERQETMSQNRAA